MKSLISSLFFLMIYLSSFSYTGEILKSFKSPGKWPTGMAFDGQNLWVADRKADKIFCIDPENGKQVREIPSPAWWPTGMAWDGQNLWCADIKGGLPLSENFNGKVYQLDPQNGNILRALDVPVVAITGLCWDGEYLWCTDHLSREIVQFDPDDGTTIRSFKAPARDPRGIAFDGTYLWVSDRISDEIYMIEPENGKVINIIPAPGPFPRGMAWDGTKLWNVDSQSDMIYQLTVRDDEGFRAYNPRKAKVRVIQEFTNFGPGDALSTTSYFALPVDRPSQKINKITYSSKPERIHKDSWGQETAVFEKDRLKPDEKREAWMLVEAELYQLDYFIFPDQVGDEREIPEDISKRYLVDNEKYQLDHPVIQKGLKEALGDTKNLYWKARRIFDYLIDHMYYEMQGGWNTAPTVLERGNGSCSEYSFVYIAMCRAAGIPARYVGSVVYRGDDAAMDDVFHRWVEIYLPNFGWIPVDPSRGDRDNPRDQAIAFGHLSNRFVITTQSGGGSEIMEWTYNVNSTYTSEPKAFVVQDHFADWEIGE